MTFLTLFLTHFSQILRQKDLEILFFPHFQTMFHFYTPLKTSENIRFSGVI